MSDFWMYKLKKTQLHLLLNTINHLTAGRGT